MKSFVIMTYYQLMHATAMTLYLNEKTNLYVISNYLKTDDSFIDRIIETGVYNKVIKIDQEEGMEPYDLAMKKTEGMTPKEIDVIGSSIFEKYLEPAYEKMFVDADFDDEIYVYNDLQRPYYYIAKHFNNIVGVEDGYGSIAQQIKIHRFKGKYALVSPFVGKYYPRPLYKHENVRRIISSCNFENLPEYYKNKIEVLDFNELVELNREDFIKAQEIIFNIESVSIENDSILVLTQPLSRAKYCSAIENFLLFKKIIAEEKKHGKHIYVKPHPADTFVDYELLEDEQVTVIPRNFPIELLEYRGIRFSKAVSFGTTAIVDKICDECRYIYSGEVTLDKVSKAIKRYIGNEKLKLNIYIKLTDMLPDRYINAFNFCSTINGFKTRVFFVVESNNIKEYKEYFNKKHLNKRIRECTINQKSKLAKRILYRRQLRGVDSVPIIECDRMDDVYIYDNIIKKDSFDYFLLIDDYNDGFTTLKKINKMFDKWVKLCVACYNYTYRENDMQSQVFLGTGKVGSAYTDQVSNRVWHRSILNHIGDSDTVGIFLGKNNDRIKVMPTILLHRAYEDYSSIEDGKDYFIKKVQSFLRENYSIEIMENKIALIAREYYDWELIMWPKMKPELMRDFFNSTGIDSESLYRIESYFIEQFIEERKYEFNRPIYKIMDKYEHYRSGIDKYIKNGFFDRVLLLNRILNKIKKMMKKVFN